MAWVRRVLVVFGLLLGCGRTTNDVGGETNWLSCDVDEDCPSGIHCHGGYCAPPSSSGGSQSAGGSSAMTSEPLPQSDDLPCDIGTVLTNSCFGIGCHGANTPAAQLDMESPGVEARLVDVPASHADILDGSDSQCFQGELRVDSANPQRSVLLKKILGTQSCGSKMPISPRSLTTENAECVRQWVYRLAGKDPSEGEPIGTGGSGSGGTAGTGGI
jgi:hypothetical protein